MKKYCIFAATAGFILLIAGLTLGGICASMGYDVEEALDRVGFGNSSSNSTSYATDVTYIEETYTDNSNDYESYSVSLGIPDNFKGISVNIPVADIYISNGYGDLSIYAYGIDTAKFSCAVNDSGILEINYDNSFLEDKIHFSEDGFEFSDFEAPHVSVNLPENIILSDISVTANTGSLYFSGITAETLSTSLSAGDLNLDCVNISVSSDISMTAGNAYIDSCILHNFKISNTAGNIYTDETRLTGTTEIDSLAGNTTLNLQGSADEYTFDIPKFAGELTVDDSSVIPSTSGSNTIKVNKTAGNCEINFND